ncbi:MAG: DSBA oxidoreductase [Candidatus Peregrinibacteria bacterium Gr01-1014_25]|nr:MAG: DSBA oxidoreductase [Candidatus Peregrinibacteria bacterium Gr01-1014_25]
MRLRLLPALALLGLAACVDMTGISGVSTKTPHPASAPQAAVTVMEYADVQCPACKAAHERIVKPLLASHGSKMRYEFRNFPLSSIHRYASAAAQAAECAADQKKFWEFLDLAYEEQEKLNDQQLRTWAEDLALDADLFDRCLRSRAKKPIVTAEYDEGRTLGVSGTPSFFVNGQRVESDLKALQTAIDGALGAMKQRL